MKTLLLDDLSPTSTTDKPFNAFEIDELFHDTVSLFEGNDLNFVNSECDITTAD